MIPRCNLRACRNSKDVKQPKCLAPGAMQWPTHTVGRRLVFVWSYELHTVLESKKKKIMFISVKPQAENLTCGAQTCGDKHTTLNLCEMQLNCWNWYWIKTDGKYPLQHHLATTKLALIRKQALVQPRVHFLNSLPSIWLPEQVFTLCYMHRFLCSCWGKWFALLWEHRYNPMKNKYLLCCVLGYSFLPSRYHFTSLIKG